jgi:hypothetical protein
VQPADLVFTEVRGPQRGGVDTYGQWLEVYNAGPNEIDLLGLHLHLTRLDGSGPRHFVIRTPNAWLAPEHYAVLGHHDPSDLPEFVDVSWFGDDFVESADGSQQARDLEPSAVVEMLACDVTIDRVVYRNLPPTGSHALDGAQRPSADLNDDEMSWCNDRTEPTHAGPQVHLGVPGTPGAPNRACESHD